MSALNNIIQDNLLWYMIITGKMGTKNNWSNEVTKHSIALDLKEGVFTWKDPKRIAISLKDSAENSLRRKASPFQSAMSMLNFYINRAGKKLPKEKKEILKQAKIELRKLFGKESPSPKV